LNSSSILARSPIRLPAMKSEEWIVVAAKVAWWRGPKSFQDL
jgi:hypothetical protein